jgi:hypothetical protein
MTNVIKTKFGKSEDENYNVYWFTLYQQLTPLY